jgi:hypothetical protein
MKLENFIGTQFGGLGRQVINPGKAPTQVTKRFSGAKGGEKEQKDFEALDTLEQEDADKRVITNRKAQRLFNELKDLPPDQRQQRVQNLLQSKEIDARVIEKMGELIVDTAKGFNDFEKVFRSKPNDVKASFLIDKLGTLPVEERKAYFQNLAAKGLITEKLMEEIAAEIKSRAQSRQR